MQLRNETGEETVYTAQDGGPTELPFLKRLLLFLLGFLGRLRTLVDQGFRHWWVGNTCFGWLTKGETYEPPPTRGSGHWNLTVTVMAQTRPTVCSKRGIRPEARVRITLDDDAGCNIDVEDTA
jgi:hypothetical protein